MKQLVILSGKGGTGKTSVAAACAHLAHAGPAPLRAVLADTDVDAANFGLVLGAVLCEEHEFVGGGTAVIDPASCEGCGVCAQVCRFDAVMADGPRYAIDPLACDGCAACVYACPTRTIRMEPQVAGRWQRSDTRYGPLFHAALYPARANSGKLVTLVKQRARLLALDRGDPLLIIDGPPGIGCPVISAVAGADLALLVAEPTVAGAHDLERALETVRHFRVPALVCVNKADVYPEGAARIEAYCREERVEMAGRIPFDAAVTQAMVLGVPVTAYAPEAPASRALEALWLQLAARLGAGEER